MEAYQERVVEEKRELDEKLGKLLDFICTARFLALPPNERARMAFQRLSMKSYSEVLGERIEAFIE